MTEHSLIRYVFKKRSPKHEYSSDDRLRLRRDIRRYLQDLKDYNISLKKLCGKTASYEDRNKILNLSLILINSPSVAEALVKTRSLAMLEASRATGVSHHYLEEFRDYVIAYMLLFGTEEHSFLSRQLSIGTRLGGDREPRRNDLGFKLRDFGVTKAALTPYGEFRFLDTSTRGTEIGDFIVGTPALLRPNRALLLAGAAALLTLLIILFSFVFYHPVRSFTVIGPVEASFSFNRFGRLVDTHGINGAGRRVLEDIVYSDKKLDSSLALFLDQAVKAEEVASSSDLTLIVVEGSFGEEEFKGDELLRELKENRLRIKVNMGGGEGFIVSPQR